MEQFAGLPASVIGISCVMMPINERLSSNSNRWRGTHNPHHDVWRCSRLATSGVVPPPPVSHAYWACCWVGCYDWTRPRTKLGEKPQTSPVAAPGHPPWRAWTLIWTRSSCRNSAAWAPLTKTCSSPSFRDCLGSSWTLPAALSSWTWQTGEYGDARPSRR